MVDTARSVGTYWGNQDWHQEVRDLVFPALEAAHALVGRVPDLTHAALLEVEIRSVVDLANGSRLGDAQQLLAKILLPWTGQAGVQGTYVEVLAADVALNAVNWKDCEDFLARAERSLQRASDADSDLGRSSRAALFRTRAQLQLEKGLLDLAFDDAKQAYEWTRNGSDDSQAGTDIWMQVRICYAQQRFDAALALWEEFRSSPTYTRLQASNPALLTKISIRVARCVVDQALCGDEADPQASVWLHEAIEHPSTAQAERNFARMQLATWFLDRRQPELAGEHLRAVRTALSGNREPSQMHPRMVLAGLELRLALELPTDPETIGTAVAEAEQALTSLLDVWKQEPASPVGRGPLFFDDRRGLLSELIRARLRLHGPQQGAERGLTDVLALQEIGSLARLMGAQAATIEQVRATLLDGSNGVLVYLPGRVRMHVFAIDREGIDCLALDLDQVTLDRARLRLLSAVLEAQKSQAPAQDAQYRAAASTMFGMLFSPALRARTAGWEAVSVVGLDSVGYIPFEVLQGEDGVPLGLKLALTYFPSLPVALALRAQAERDSRTDAGPLQGRILLGSGSAASSGFAGPKVELNLSHMERKRLALEESGIELKLIESAPDLASALATHDHKRLDFLHIIGHGVTDDARTRPQGIQLVGTKVIWSDEFSGPSPPRLVLLSVCNAGRGTMRRGDDGAHLLSGALLAWGTPTVVLPRVEVSVEGALAFAEPLQRLVLVEGVPFDVAALRARRLAHQEKPTLLDPLLFHVVGLANTALQRSGSQANGQDGSTNQRSRTMPWIAGIVLVLVGYYFSRRVWQTRAQRL